MLILDSEKQNLKKSQIHEQIKIYFPTVTKEVFIRDFSN